MVVAKASKKHDKKYKCIMLVTIGLHDYSVHPLNFKLDTEE